MTAPTRPARSKVRHGMASCAKYGCKRPECLRAHRRAHAQGELARAHGITGRVDATQASKHVQRLVRAGMSVNDVAARTGITRSTVGKLAVGRATRIYRTTHEAVLGVRVPARGCRPQADGFIDATGSKLRLQALSALGFTRTLIATEVGVSKRTVGDIRRGEQRRVHLDLHIAINAAYSRLWNQNPADHGVPSHIAAGLRTSAAAAGWKRPLDLDEDALDTPGYQPVPVEDPAGRDDLLDLRREEIEHLASFGLAEQEIATRLGMSPKYVRTRLVEWRTGRARKSRAKTAA